MAPLHLPLSAATVEAISDPSESVPEGRMPTKPALEEFKTIMETL